MLQGCQAVFSGPKEIPDGPPVTLRLQRGEVFAADVAMDAALLRHPRPMLPAAEVRLHLDRAAASAGTTITRNDGHA